MMRILATATGLGALAALTFAPTCNDTTPVRWGLVLLAVALAAVTFVLASGARYDNHPREASDV